MSNDGSLDRFYHDMNVTSYTFGTFSLCGSFAVLLTGYLFRPLRREVFFQLICLTSFCDLMFSMSAAWGPNTSMSQCVTQGIFQGYFILSSVFFVLLLNWTMFCRLQFQKQYLNVWHMCLLGLVLPCILVTIPLSDKQTSYYDTYNYGRGEACTLAVTTRNIDDDTTLRAQQDVFQNWYDGVFTWPMSIAIGLMIVLCCTLYLYTVPKIRRDDHKRAERVLKLVNYISLYPLAMILLVGPFQIFFIVVSRLGYDVDELPVPSLKAYYLTFVLRFLYGFVAAIIFFTNSSAATQYWKVWFVRNIGVYFGMEEENQLLKGLSPEERSEMGMPEQQSKRPSLSTRFSIQKEDGDIVVIGDYEDDDYGDFDSDDDYDMEMALAMTFFNPVALARRKSKRPSNATMSTGGRQGSVRLGVVIEKEVVNPIKERTLEDSLSVMSQWDDASKQRL